MTPGNSRNLFRGRTNKFRKKKIKFISWYFILVKTRWWKCQFISVYSKLRFETHCLSLILKGNGDTRDWEEPITLRSSVFFLFFSGRGQRESSSGGGAVEKGLGEWRKCLLFLLCHNFFFFTLLKRCVFKNKMWLSRWILCWRYFYSLSNVFGCTQWALIKAEMCLILTIPTIRGNNF